jgi:hypothetical protein
MRIDRVRFCLRTSLDGSGDFGRAKLLLSRMWRRLPLPRLGRSLALPFVEQSAAARLGGSLALPLLDNAKGGGRTERTKPKIGDFLVVTIREGEAPAEPHVATVAASAARREPRPPVRRTIGSCAARQEPRKPVCRTIGSCVVRRGSRPLRADPVDSPNLRGKRPCRLIRTRRTEKLK